MRLLDEVIDEPAAMVVSHDWGQRAYALLLSFIADHNRMEFTSEEFHRWAAYYHDLEEPPHFGQWAYILRRAQLRGIIRSSRKVKSNDSNLTSIWEIN